MKKITFLISFLFVSVAYAQLITIHSQDFNGTAIPSGWTTYETGTGTDEWTFGSGVIPGAVDDFTTKAAIFNDDAAGNDNLHDLAYLYYTAGSVSGYANTNLYIRYQYAFNNVAGEKLKVVIWNSSNASWIVLEEYTTDTNPTYDTVDITAALNANAGINPANLIVGFAYDDVDGAWGYGAGIDNFSFFAQPVNDYCVDATQVTVYPKENTCTSPTIASNQGATDSSGSSGTPACGSFNGGDVWYSFVAPSSGSITINVPAAGNWSSFAYAIYGGGCPSTSTVAHACDYITSSGTDDVTGLTPGATYKLRAWDYGNNDIGTIGFCLKEKCTSAPANDLLTNAFTATNISYTHANVAVTCANSEGGAFGGCGYGTLNTVFYKFQCTVASTVTSTVTNPQGTSAAAFYESPTINPTAETQLTRVNQATNPCDPMATYSIQTTVGKNYFVVLSNGSTTGITINGINDPSAALVDTEIFGLQFFPNPVNDMLNIKANENIEAVVVYNVLGQEVMRNQYNNDNIQLDFSNMTKGVYVVETYINNQRSVYKIVKE
jgi:hypothetical protein